MEAEIQKIYRNPHQLKDDTFQVDDLEHYDLLLQIGADTFKAAVTDHRNNRCLFLDYYDFQGSVGTSDMLSQLQVIYDEHHLLRANFWRSVRLSLKHREFTLVPNSLFSAQEAEAYLVPLAGNTLEGSEVRHFKQPGSDAVNIFSAEKSIINWFKKTYPKKTIDVFHHTAPLIEGVLRQPAESGEPRLFLSVDKDFVTILATKDKKLLYVNIFDYSATNDFLYYVMFVMDELKLDPEVTQVTVWGGMTPDSVIYDKLYKYIRNIELGKRPTSLKFGYKFDEVMDHRHYDLFCLHLCE